MAITLRDNTGNNTGKGAELTYLEMDTNLESYYYSSSYASGILYLHTTGSDTHSIDLSGFVDDLETGSLVRVSALNTATGSFITTASAALNVITFTKGNGTTFTVTVNTGSGVGGGSGLQPSDTGSFYYSSSVNLNTITFFQGDGTTDAVTVNTGSASNRLASLEAATGSYVYSGSYIGANTIRLYSKDVNHDIDLTALAGGIATDITQLNAFTGSAQTSLTALNGATGSYVYSGSFDGVDTITLYSKNTNYLLDLGALAGGGSGLQPSATGSLMVTGSVNLNTLSFTKGDGSTFTLTVNTGSGAGGGGLITVNDLDVTPDPFIVLTNTLNFTGSGVTVLENPSGEAQIFIPGATGGTTSPGGSNTHIQFNQLGSFGGDSAFAYTSGSQIVTIDKSTPPTAAAPHIRLLGSSSNAGAITGVIAASATTQNSAPASIQFKNAVAHGLGNFDTDVVIKTAFAGGGGTTTERTALTLTASGDAYFDYDIYAPGLDNTAQSNFVGFNTTTGKLTYFSTGSFVINTGSLQNPSISRDAPSGVSNVVFDVDFISSEADWSIQALLSSDPTSAGNATINNSNPALVTRVAFWKTASGGVDKGTKLTQLAPGSIITLSEDTIPQGIGTYRITGKTVSTNVVSYTLSYIEGALQTFSVSAPLQITTEEGVYEYTLAKGYNYLNIRNNGSSLNRLRLRYEAATATYPDGGGYIPVQILCNGSGNGYSIDYIADIKNYAWADGNGTTGTWSSTDPVVGFITNDFKPGDRFISSFLVWGEGNNEGMVPQHWTVYQSDTALEPSDRTVPTQYYQNTFNSSERVTTTSIPNIFELNGGTINIDPQGGTSDSLILGLGGLLTDYSTAINNVNGANLVQLNIVTPSAKNGWDIFWLGYRSSGTERYRVVNSGINGGVGTNSPIKLDWSGRAEVSVDYSNSKIFVWSSNWEN